jgi:hypothetical protein
MLQRFKHKVTLLIKQQSFRHPDKSTLKARLSYATVSARRSAQRPSMASRNMQEFSAHLKTNLSSKLHTQAPAKAIAQPIASKARYCSTILSNSLLSNKWPVEINDAEKVLSFLYALDENTLQLDDVIATTTKEKILNATQAIISQGEQQRILLENEISKNNANKLALQSDLDKINQAITAIQLLSKQLVTAIHVNDIAGSHGLINEKSINDKFTLAKQHLLHTKNPDADVSKVSAANTAKAFMFLFKKILKTTDEEISVINIVRALTHLDTKIFANQQVENKLISKAQWLESQHKFVLFRSDIFKFLHETMAPQFKDASYKETIKAVIALTAEWYLGIFNRSKEGKAMQPNLQPFARFFTPRQSYASLEKVLDIIHGTSLKK